MRVQDIMNGPDGQIIIQILSKLLMGNPTPSDILRRGRPIPGEIVREAEMILLVKRNPGVSREEQVDLLRRHAFRPYSDGRGVYVFFPSSVAPECDSFAYWEEIEKNTNYPGVDNVEEDASWCNIKQDIDWHKEDVKNDWRQVGF